MRLFKIFPALFLYGSFLCAQSAQFTHVDLGIYDQLAGIPVCPTEITRMGNTLFALIPEPSTQDAGRLYRSDDNGSTWTKINLFSSDGPDDKIVELHATATSLILFKYRSKWGGDGYFKDDITGFRSVDGGQTFDTIFYQQNLISTSKFLSIDGLDEANGQLYFYYSISGNHQPVVFLSSDDGQNWENLTDLPYVDKFSKITGANGLYYAFGRDALYEANNPFFIGAEDNAWANGSGADLLECAVYGNNLYFCNADGLVLSSNPQLTNIVQTQLPFPLSAAMAYNGFWYFNNQGHFYRAPLQDPANLSDAGYIPMAYTSSGSNIFHNNGRFSYDGSKLLWLNDTPLESTDGGLNWQLASGQFPQYGGTLFHFNGQFWLIHRDLIFRSPDGTSWELYRNPTGLPEGQYDWHAMIEMQGSIFVTQFDYYDNTKRKVYRSDDNGASWTQVWQGLERPTLQVDVNKQRLFLVLNPLLFGSPGQALQYSDDLGNTWNTVPGATNFSSFDAKGDTIFYFSKPQIHYTYNLGQNWQVTNQSFNFQYGDDLLMFPNGQALLFDMGTEIGYATLDGGQTFAEIFDLQNFGTVLNASHIDRFDSALIGWGSTGTFISTNMGLNWIYFFEGDWLNCQEPIVSDGFLYMGRSGSFTSFEDPSLRTPLQPLLDQANLVSTIGGVVIGKTFYDLNGDCFDSFSDPERPNEVFAFQPGNFLATSESDGAIRRILPQGNYTMQYSTPLYHIGQCFNPPNLTVTPNTQTPFTLGFKPNQQVKDLWVSVVGTPARPGMPLHVTVNINNIGTQLVPAGTVLSFTYPNGPFSFTDALPVPSSQSPGQLQYILPDVPPYSGLTYKIDLQLPPDPSLAGQTFYISAGLSGVLGDPTPANNSYTWPVFVVNSYDPNDKTAFTSSPTGELPYKEKELRYLIRFQNTGTDTAFRVVVRDTLSGVLDWTSLHTLAASHPFRLTMNDPGVAAWHFDNILLPDSTTNEPASHGFVLFGIRARDGSLHIGDTLHNRAAIYFDFNDPVQTNQTATPVVRRVIYRQGEEQALPAVFDAMVQPNPIGKRLACRIQLPEPAVLTVTLNDANGRVLTILENKTPYDAGEHWLIRLVDDLPAGAYWLHLQSETEQRNLQVIKQ